MPKRKDKNPSHDLPNGPEQATESGEPGETGRSQGQIIDREGIAEGKKDRQVAAWRPDVDEDLESGRHEATAR